MYRIFTAVAAACAMLSAVSAQAADPIRVGVLTPLSGTYAVLGQQIRWGIVVCSPESGPA